jgi:hypothetical protein
MKLGFLTLALTLLFASTSFGQIRSDLDLIGIWMSSQVRVEFIDNSNVSLVFPGNKKQFGTYTSDFLLDPSTLEMVFPDGNNKLEFKCLIHFVDDNTLKWESFKKNDFPLDFTGSYSILKKVKN